MLLQNYTRFGLFERQVVLFIIIILSEDANSPCILNKLSVLLNNCMVTLSQIKLETQKQSLDVI